jgi:hypothetical protein
MQAKAIMREHLYHATATQGLEDFAQPTAACRPSSTLKNSFTPIIRAGEVSLNLIFIGDRPQDAPRGPDIVTFEPKTDDHA